jgi:hypothetical protein
MSKSVGDGLDALAAAIFLSVVVWVIYRVGCGFAHYLDSYSQEQARCISISGVYGDGKCYVNGNEMFSVGEE